jgi:hypothetical protein
MLQKIEQRIVTKMYDFKNLDAEQPKIMEEYFNLRPSKMCEGRYINQLIWANYSNTKYSINGRYMLLKMYAFGKHIAQMPKCRLEDSVEAFLDIEKYFNEELNQKLIIYCADKEFVEQIKEFEDRYEITQMVDSFDYIYSGEGLRTLKGKTYHKKKNHLNSFLKEYEGRYKYKILTCDDRDEIVEFLDKWNQEKDSDDKQNRLENEKIGINVILDNCPRLKKQIAGVYVDDVLEAFTIGSYSEELNLANIHIEKANPEIRGLYNYINQQFLANAYPEVEYVNREDDMGLEGLRKAKLAYRPIEMVEKYKIIQK